MGYGGDNNLDGYMDMSTQRMPPSTDLSRGDFGNSFWIFSHFFVKIFTLSFTIKVFDVKVLNIFFPYGFEID